MPNSKPLCSGLVERIGLPDAVVTHKTYIAGAVQQQRFEMALANHQAGLLTVVKILTEGSQAVIQNVNDIVGIGHRVVHGGETFSATTLVSKEVKDQIRALITLAPLHNPANLLGIEVAERIFPKAAQVAVFDTAFHQSMPEVAFRFALPKKLYTEMGIRAYGFHGTSHRYVTRSASAHLKNPHAKMISIHLGNGCSMAAVIGGKSVDTSMGLGPMGGLVMGSRAGDLDPSVIFHLIMEMGYAPAEVHDMLNKESGMLGICGYSDMRDLREAMDQGNPDALLAHGLYAYRIRKYIGSYAAVLNGVDAIVFTAGVGENDVDMRAAVCKDMDYLGMVLDDDKNAAPGTELREIQASHSKIKVLVIPTNEELEIAQHTYHLLA